MRSVWEWLSSHPTMGAIGTIAVMGVAVVYLTSKRQHKRGHVTGNDPDALKGLVLSVSRAAQDYSWKEPSDIVVELLRRTKDNSRKYAAQRTMLEDDVLRAIESTLPRLHTRSLWDSILIQHRGLRALENRRKTAFDETKIEHVSELRELWNAAKFPADAFSLSSELWSDLGFQGLNPTTDFRGGGMLALDHLRSFARRHPQVLQEMMRFNKEQLLAGESSWYLTAVVSIQFTVQLLSQRDHEFAPAQFKVLYDGATKNGDNDDDGVTRLHHALMIHFKKHWERDLPFVMDFNQYMPKVYKAFFV